MVEIHTLAGLATGVILLWAAAAKLAARDPSRLEPYGIPPALRAPGYFGLALIEAAVGALLLVRVSAAVFAAIGLGVLFTLALARVRARGIRRLDCGCFGAKERSTDVLIARALAFTGLAALAASSLTVSTPSRDALVFAAVAVLAVAVVVLGALVLALYRQVGVLTLRVGPGVALELAEEGPPAAEPAPELDGLAGSGPELVAFFSEGCRLCRELAPAVRALARDGLPVRVVYEDDEPDAFERWRVPGTPFAVHVVNGTVAAKGTVNTLEQLEELVSLGVARSEHAAA
jgi:Thioredoxin domain/Methylamine utilisation protein MauE